MAGMKTSRWITLTEEAVVNMEGNASDVDMSLQEWMELLYETLMDHEHDDD
jgi:hypothetical protein